MKETKLLTVWKALREARRQIRSHEHNYYELVYYVRGAGETAIGSETYSFAQGTYGLIPPKILHSEVHHVQSQVICVGFQTDLQLSSGVFRDTNSGIYRTVNSLLTETLEQKSYSQEMLSAKLTELVIELHRLNHAEPARRNFAYAIRYLSENYFEKISCQELSEDLNVSYDYFQHHFKQLTGLSPRGFLLKKRIEAAKALLQNTDCSCTEIAYQCGFSNSAQFAMLFKREQGMTPQEYRKGQLFASNTSLKAP